MSVNPYRSDRLEAEGDRAASLILVSNQLAPSVAATTDTAGDIAGLWVTDDLLFSHQRCRRRSFLELYGNPSHRDPPSDYLRKLRQDSLAHQISVLAEAPAHQPVYPRLDWLVGAEATLALMQQGVDRIAKGVLLASEAEGVYLVSCPDLLVKQPGHSLFGDWIYVPVDTRLGKRPKMDYQVIAAFHAYVLARVQGAWSENSWLVLRQRGACAVDLVDLLPRMQDVLQDCIQTLQSPQEPEVFIANNRCELCAWFSHCYSIAKQEEHLSLLPGVTPSRYVHLKALNLTTLEALAATTPRQLEPLPGFGPLVASKLVRQAQAMLHNRAVPHHDIDPAEMALLTMAELPTAPIELYFDIESAPEHNLVYLHGVLVVDRTNQTDTFYPLVAESLAAEAMIWQQFLDLVWQYPSAPIYHFCPYEPQTVKRLAEQYDTPYALIEPLTERFIDLHERVTRVAILPVESYALKPIARWLGFNWRDPEANGAQSICWYDQWVKTGDRAYLEAILRYNEDDCRATYRVKDWLVGFSGLSGDLE